MNMPELVGIWALSLDFMPWVHLIFMHLPIPCTLKKKHRYELGLWARPEGTSQVKEEHRQVTNRQGYIGDIRKQWFIVLWARETFLKGMIVELDFQNKEEFPREQKGRQAIPG